MSKLSIDLVTDKAFTLLIAALVLATWPALGGFTAGAVVAGALLAYALRRWHDRHPSVLAARSRMPESRNPEINLSAIPVGGDVGGLIFVAGSIAIVLIGMPGLRWFVGAAMTCALVLAVALFRWRSAHYRPPVTSRIAPVV